MTTPTTHDTSSNTITQILDVAQQLIQAFGYNAFSYADIAAVVGIKKASIHYYFPSKSDLCCEVIRRHRHFFRTQLAQIDQQTSEPRQKIAQYMELYATIQLVPELICLGGMLSSAVQNLPAKVNQEVQGFFADNEAWLTDVITQGVQNGTFRAVESAQLEAQLLVAGVQGALLLARTLGEREHFRLLAQRLLDGLLQGA